jgi:hypothetical protein
VPAASASHCARSVVLPNPAGAATKDQPRPFASAHAQLIDDAAALHQPATRRRQAQLGAQHRHSVSVGPLLAQRTSERLMLAVYRSAING